MILRSPRISNVVSHLAFTLKELRPNSTRIGFRAALRFFMMRLLVPFGLPRPYFLGRRASSALVASIDRSGFAELRRLPAPAVEELRATMLRSASRLARSEFATVEAYASHLRRSEIRRQAAIVSADEADCPLAKWARSAEFAGLAAEYLELPVDRLVAEASIDMLVGVEHPRAGGGYDDALEFHRDVDAYKFLKIFVYLTDCAEGDGHHEVYLHSHRHFPARLGPIRRYRPSDIEAAIPEAVLRKVVGPAGYAFGENTMAFHRGTAPTGHHRAIFNLIYTEATFAKYYGSAFPLRSIA